LYYWNLYPFAVYKYSAIIILDTDSIEKASEIAGQDPIVKAGRIKYEFLTLMLPPQTTLKMGEIPF